MALFNRPPLTVSLYKPVVAPHGVSLLLAHHQSSMGIPYVESGGEGAVCIASRSTGEATLARVSIAGFASISAHCHLRIRSAHALRWAPLLSCVA